MNFKCIIAPFLLLFLSLKPSYAQDGYTYMGLSYSIAVPLTGTEDYISAGSYRGMNFEGYREITPKLAAGWLFGWNVFHQELRNETYTRDNLTIHGNQFRYQNEFPMMVRGLYLLGAQEGIRPYLGTGIGVLYNIRRTDIGLYSLKTDAWHFSVAPEIGILIPAGLSKITASVRYLYGVKTKELGEQSYVSFNLGFQIVP